MNARTSAGTSLAPSSFVSAQANFVPNPEKDALPYSYSTSTEEHAKTVVTARSEKRRCKVVMRIPLECGRLGKREPEMVARGVGIERAVRPQVTRARRKWVPW